MTSMPDIDVKRSMRHLKIAGDYFESLVLYILSKNGFECALVDHVGIDIVARNPHTDEFMGISVKGRTRNNDEKAGRVKINNYGDHVDKINKECDAFGGATPYLAVVVDAEGVLSGSIASISHINSNYPAANENLNWGMGDKSFDQYRDDENVKTFKYQFAEHQWW